MSDKYKIIISGEGGQGILSIAKITAKSAWNQGKKVTYVPYFSTEKRGGVSSAFVQISDEHIPFPKFMKSDLWVALSQRAIDRIYPFLKDDSVVIVNSHLVKDLSKIKKWKPYSFEFTELAKEKFDEPRTFNMIIMGAMLHFIPDVSPEGFAKSIEKTFADKYEKRPELRELNQKAFELGQELIENSK
ncbi:MAG: 2-oxoacid:acceptor oxidoreductase family protein [Patescibacteria group bacterium]|nr:2-oxoacid:acceptor oxidoreductase family protein [Patescibacteria group bacterium]